MIGPALGHGVEWGQMRGRIIPHLMLFAKALHRLIGGRRRRRAYSPPRHWRRAILRKLLSLADRTRQPADPTVAVGAIGHGNEDVRHRKSPATAAAKADVGSALRFPRSDLQAWRMFASVRSEKDWRPRHLGF